MRGLVQSLNRAIDILDALAENAEGLRLMVLSERVGLAASTTHRLLITLEQRHCVHFERQGSLWQIGGRCFTLGSTYWSRFDVAARALPHMRRLRDTTGETVNFAVEDGDELRLLVQLESPKAIAAIARPGGRPPFHASGYGKAILSVKENDAVRRMIGSQVLPRFTPRTIVRASILLEELVAARTRGYSVDDGECSEGIRCVAAPIVDGIGGTFAAISLSGPKARMTDERLRKFGPLLVSVAENLAETSQKPVGSVI